MFNDNDKLVQIMPTPKPMKAIYENENGVQHEEDIFCVGLNALGDVVFLALDNMGVVSDVKDAENFLTITEGEASASFEDVFGGLEMINKIKF